MEYYLNRFSPVNVEDAKTMPYEEAYTRIRLILELMGSGWGFNRRQKIRLADEAFKLAHFTCMWNYHSLRVAVYEKLKELMYDTNKDMRHFQLKWQKYYRTEEIEDWVGLDGDAEDKKDGDWEPF